MRIRTWFAALGWFALSSLLRAQDPKPVADTEARSPEAERAGFKLPAGFEIQLVVSEPAIGKPMNLAFDARGRLWVTSTVEYPFAVAEGKPGRDRVLVLSDFAADGRAGKVATFADGLNIPIGVLPLGAGDSALVHSIPSVRRYTDTDGDGRADRSDPAYAEFGARDTHGMTNAFTRGFDGWIYACHGFSNTSTVRGSDGRPVLMESGNIYRFQPDGSHAEYFSHGQVNPFGLAFDAFGRLYSCDCHSRPIYQNLRGAYYPSFGRADDGLGFGPEMIKHDHGSTGIGGIAIDEGNHFPNDHRGSIFIGNVVTGRVHRDTIAWEGSSPRAVTQPDLVVSDDPWFHPVDLEFGPDGALYIADFYNRIIGHYEVPLDHPGRDRERGRIWRVVYHGRDGQNSPPTDSRPDAPQASVADLVADLGHPSLVVRSRATDLLVERGRAAVEPVIVAALEHPSAWQLVHALWALQRLGALDEARLLAASRHEAEVVRVHAARIWGDRDPLGAAGAASVAAGLRDPSLHVRRAATEALGAHPGLTAIRPLLDLITTTPTTDDHLRHVARIALRDSLLDDATWDKITLAPSDQAIVADVALGAPTAGAARFLLARLADHPEPTPYRDRQVGHIARYGAGDPQPALVAWLNANQFTPGERAGLLKSVARGTRERGRAVAPAVLAAASAVASTWLGATDSQQVKAGVELASTLELTAVADLVAALIPDRNREPAIRAAALTGLANLDPSRGITLAAGLIADAAEPDPVRAAAIKLLGGSGQPQARAALLAALKLAPAATQITLAAALAATRPGAEALLAAVAGGQASPRALSDRAVVAKIKAAALPDLDNRLALLLKDVPPADERIQALITDRRRDFATIPPADPTLGAAVFRKNCAACHQLGGVGARVGPQLDGIGARGVDRLCEDILDPNRNVDQAFRVTNLALNDGRTVAGLLLRQDGEILILADAEGKEVRVAESTVEDRKIAQLSPMPANFADTIPAADFRHLLAYLLVTGPAATSR